MAPDKTKQDHPDEEWPHVSPVAQRLVAVESQIAPHLAASHVARMFYDTHRPAGDKPALPEGGIRYDLLAFDFEVGPTIGYGWGNPQTLPVVLLIHGWNGWGLELARFVPALLGKGFAVVAIDHFGHGRSPGNHNSFAGFVRTVRQLVNRYPKVAGIIAHGVGGTATAGFLARSGLPIPTVVIGGLAGARTYIERFAKEAALPPALVDEMQRRIEEEDHIHFDDISADKCAPKITAPVLLVYDQSDEIAPLSIGQKLVGLIPGASLVTTRGLGHSGLLANPDVIKRAAEHIASHNPAH